MVSESKIHSRIELDDVKAFNGLLMLSWNVRSLLKKFAEFEACIDTMKPDLICLSETWLNAATPDSVVSLADFNLIRQDRSIDSCPRRGGGVCIYTSKKLDCDFDKYSYLNTCDGDIELCIISVNLIQTKPLTVISCYRPRSGNIDSALCKLKNVLSELPQGGESFILGDLNIDYDCKKSNSYTKLKTLNMRINSSNSYLFLIELLVAPLLLLTIFLVTVYT